MGIFGKKKKRNREEATREDEKQKYINYIKSYTEVSDVPEDIKKSIYSREYKIYRKTEKEVTTWYERLARFSSSILKIKADRDTAEPINRALGFIGYRITADDVFSLMITSIIFFVVAGMVMIITGAVPLMAGLIIAAMGIAVGYYLFKYPENQVKVIRIQASSQVVLCILYMVVSMRVSPSLENAMRFAASNISGALAWDLRRMLWDIQMQKYVSASDALSDYISKWKAENEEFAEALRLIKESTQQAPDRAREILDESLNVILDGTKTRMKHYAQDLNMPVMVIHMMGIVLPVMGTIMAPLAAVFLSDLVRPEHFIIGYDIILPLIIIWFINNILKKRPVTISQVDISKYPGIPPKGSMFLGGRSFPVLPLAAIVAGIIMAVPLLFFVQNPDVLLSGQAEHTIMSLAFSLLLIMGAAFGMAVYFILTNFQKMKIQKTIESIEGEFEYALFQLGNRISGGNPTEVAVEKSIEDMKDLKIADMFRLALRNMRTLGLTFEEALFNEKYGALRYYPSRLVENIMYAVVDTAKKGVRFASESMLRIANYMKNIRETQEYIRDLLSETVSSMKFQAYFLTPLITGLIVSMSDIIVKVLIRLGEYLKGVGIQEELGIGDISKAFGNMESAVAPEMFQLIVGVYMVEVILILAMFLTKINYGENKTIQYYNTGIMLLIAVTIYFLVAMSASTVFGDMIESALSSLGVT